MDGRAPEGLFPIHQGDYRFPVTMALICEALKRARDDGKSNQSTRSSQGVMNVSERRLQLRRMTTRFKTLANFQQRDESRGPTVLWRGLKNLKVPPQFHKRGGTHLGPMSTSEELRVALKYAKSAGSKDCLLLKVIATNFLSTGVNLQYLSCFPAEKEYLYRTCPNVERARARADLSKPTASRPSITSLTPRCCGAGSAMHVPQADRCRQRGGLG